MNHVILRALIVCGLIAGALASARPAAAAVCTIKGINYTATITGSGTINGTAGNDVIVGSAVRDVIYGNGGADIVCSLGGNDDVTLGAGPATARSTARAATPIP